MPPSARPKAARRSLRLADSMIESLEGRQMLAASTSSRRVVGYFPEYRYTSLSKIDLSALTHINYFSITATDAGALTTSGVNTSHLATVRNAAHAKGVTVSITIGPQAFSVMAASAAGRDAFATNIISYVQANDLDGIDFDWEPPATSTNKTNYGLLIDAVYAKAHPLGLLLSAAVNPITTEIPVAQANKLDWINIMGYDFDPANHSPYAASTKSLVTWNNYGVAKDKLVLGVPFYGRKGTTWSNTATTSYGTAVDGYKTTNGTLPPASLDLINGYYMNGPTTIAAKSQYVIDNNFGGVMIWELGTDHYDSAGKTDAASLLPVIKSVIQPGQQSFIDTVAIQPGRNTTGYSNEPVSLAVSITGRLATAGVMQIVLTRADGTQASQSYTVISAASPTYSGTITIQPMETSPATRTYTVTARFRPLATTGPLVGAIASDAVATTPYVIAWLPTRDTIAPAVVAKSFMFETGPAIQFAFDDDVDPTTISAGDLVIRRTSDNASMNASSFSYDAATRSIVFRLPVDAADGDYVATLGTGSIADAAGNALQNASSQSFFLLAGDANRDRSVDFSDLIILAQNYNASGRTLSQGNLDYSADGKVDFNDLIVLAQRYNTTMVASPAIAAAAAAPTRAKRPSIVSQLM